MEEKLDKFLAYLEENGVEISGETAFKCDDGIVLFSPNEGGLTQKLIVQNVSIYEIIMRAYTQAYQQNGVSYRVVAKKGYQRDP